MEAVKHISTLEKILASWPNLLVAASGGMDSSFLAFMAHSVLGGRMMAVSVRSQFSITREMAGFARFAERTGMRHEIIEADVLGVDDIAKNGRDRCYHCKKAVFSLIKDLASRQGYGIVADGSNLSDLGDFRPGKRALEELGIVSPLSLAGFDKAIIREAVEHLGVDLPFRHSNSCLATRVEYGIRIDREILGMIAAAEELLHGMGYEPVRVRYHNGVARVELSVESVKSLINDDERRTAVADGLRAAGFAIVTVDLDGFRSGSMNLMQGMPPGRDRKAYFT